MMLCRLKKRAWSRPAGSRFDSTVIFSPYWKKRISSRSQARIDLVLGRSLLISFTFRSLWALAIAIKASSPEIYFTGGAWWDREADPSSATKFQVDGPAMADELKGQLEPGQRRCVARLQNDPRPAVTGGGKMDAALQAGRTAATLQRAQGEMSLVGPRPPLLSEYQHFTAYQKQKVSVKPGMTGLWQVQGRNRINDLMIGCASISNISAAGRVAGHQDFCGATLGVVFTGSGK